MTRGDNIADLELRVLSSAGLWQLVQLLVLPGDAGSIQEGPFPIALTTQTLLEHVHDPAAYGAALSAMLFADSAARTAFDKARAAVLNAGQRLRVRLHLPAALHHLRWETLTDLSSRRHLALEEELLLLSRYLSGDEYQLVHLRPRRALQMLAAVASPKDAGDYGLAPLDPEDELVRLDQALLGIAPGPRLGGKSAPVTWEVLEAGLRSGCDILYLVAHGALIDGRPTLYLERADGTTLPFEGTLLVNCIRGLDHKRPLLVVLASCDSAGDGYDEAMAALGPQLALAGVPVVLAMQGQLSVETGALFQERFFKELLTDGRADRAAAVARFAVAPRSDWWMPVLYTRLQEGRIWSEEQDSGHLEHRRLDAAMPAEATVGEPSEVWVQICQPGSPGFRKYLPSHTRFGDVITSNDVRDNELPILFPQGRDGRPKPTRLRIELYAPNFKVQASYLETVLLPQQDTARLTFNLVAARARQHSSVSVTVKQQQQDNSFTVAGSISLETTIHPRGAGLLSHLRWNITSIGLAVMAAGGGKGGGGKGGGDKGGGGQGGGRRSSPRTDPSSGSPKASRQTTTPPGRGSSGPRLYAGKATPAGRRNLSAGTFQQRGRPTSGGVSMGGARALKSDNSAPTSSQQPAVIMLLARAQRQVRRSLNLPVQTRALITRKLRQAQIDAAYGRTLQANQQTVEALALLQQSGRRAPQLAIRSLKSVLRKLR